MKHAFLIIAHDNWDIVQMLVAGLDNEGNDIFLHIDRKAKAPSVICTKKSGLYVIKNPVDVRWGSVSQIKSEYKLFEEALRHNEYEYYHLISGAHLPLMDFSAIREWFEIRKGNTVFKNLGRETSEYQETLKMRRLNLFIGGYQSKNAVLSRFCQFLWKSSIAIQRLLEITVNTGNCFYKASNWASFTQEAVEYLVTNKKRILKKYRYSFCGDEFFAPTELMESPLKDKILSDDKLLYCNIVKANAEALSVEKDYPRLLGNGYVFARKFVSEQ